MPRLLACVGALSASVIITACSNGGGGPLPYSAPPNNAGGSNGTFQSGATGTALLRFVQGSPDDGSVDVCVDNLPFGVTAPSVAYGAATASLYAVGGGITHTVSIFPSLGAAQAGQECATAPGPYFGTPAIAVTTLAPGTSGSAARQTIVLGGTAASHTLGLYVYGEPSFAVTPASNEAISHNAAPAFSAATPNHTVGFGLIPTSGAATNLTGASNIAAPSPSTSSAALVNSNVTSTFAAVPASFYTGIGLPAGTVAPVSTVAAPSATVGAPYVVELYAIDAAGGTVRLLAVPEQVTGFGF